MRIAIYARYSTDNQKDTSIEDQIRLCREQLHRMEIRVTSECIYQDKAETGATMHLRPGIKQLVADASEDQFDIVIAEMLNRYSRDQEDTAFIFKRLNFHQVKMLTASRGEVNEMDIGFESTINARYLKDCADQVRRGLRGHVERGKNPGGLSYGYQITKRIDDNGEVETGLLDVNEEQASVIRRIYEEYAAGKSPRAIVKALNVEGIPSPKGGKWRMNTLHGNGVRGSGILRNQKYIGYLVWNRTHAVRSPYNGKRIFRPNPRGDWIVVEKPEWQIITDELWDKAQKRRRKYAQSSKRPEKARRPTKLLSGLLRCGCCGGTLAIRSSGKNGRGEQYAPRYGCSNYREGACSNSHRIEQPELERRILDALHDNLMAPEAWQAFMDGYCQQKKEEQQNKRAGLKSAQKELRDINKKIEAMLDAVEAGLFRQSMVTRMNSLSDRKEELEALLKGKADKNPVSLHPGMGRVFKEKIADLQRFLNAGDELPRLQTRERIRDLISKIILTPLDNGKN